MNKLLLFIPWNRISRPLQSFFLCTNKRQGQRQRLPMCMYVHIVEFSHLHSPSLIRYLPLCPPPFPHPTPFLRLLSWCLKQCTIQLSFIRFAIQIDIAPPLRSLHRMISKGGAYQWMSARAGSSSQTHIPRQFPISIQMPIKTIISHVYVFQDTAIQVQSSSSP